MCLFLCVLDKSNISYTFVFFIIVGIMSYFAYVLNINFRTKENFNNKQPKIVNYETKLAKKELEMLTKIKQDLKKRHNPKFKFVVDPISKVFDIDSRPEKLISIKKHNFEKQKIKQLENEIDAGESINSRLPPLRFDGIY